MYKILLVDDNYVQLQSLLSYIDPKEFNISGIKITQSSLEAIEICRHFKPDIVITDIAMPEMYGTELTQKIKEICSNAQFIYISCYDDVSYFKSAIENEVLAYLIKPIIPDELKKALTKAIEKLSKNNADSLQVSRENFIYRLLYSENSAMSYLHESTKALSMQKFTQFIIAELKITNPDSNFFADYANIKSLKNSINCLSEAIVLAENPDTIIILFMNETAENFSETVRSIVCDKIKELYDHYAVPVKSGASDVGSNLFDLQPLLKQAEYALNTNLELIGSDYIAYSDISLKTSDFDFISYNKEISSLVSSGVLPTETDSFISGLKTKSVDYDESLLKELYLSAISSIQSIFMNYDIDIMQILGRKDLSYHKINRFTDIETFCLWLKNLLTLTGEYLNNYKKNSQFALAEKTISYIHRNYASISSIEEIAASLFVSYSHLRNVFKKEVGVTIHEFLLSVRMEEAKKLLSTSTINLTQIAYDVGYRDYDYFKSVFTKYNGISPKEYQKQHEKIK